MSTTFAPRGGGVDRTGLENILGDNGHPMNGLAYSKSLLGGHLLGVLPLTDGRYACFFKEYSHVAGGKIEQSNNRLLVVSAVSGNSLVTETGLEGREWVSFDGEGSTGHLLTRGDEGASLTVFQARAGSVNQLGTFPTPVATNDKGARVEFDSGVSLSRGTVSVSSVLEGELYVAQSSQANLGGTWSFLSENTTQRSREGIKPQRGVKGPLEVGGTIHLVTVSDAQFVFSHSGGDVLVFKKNRYGVWTRSSKIEAPERGEVLGFCLIRSLPAYSESGYRYSIPAVFSMNGEPISQRWVLASIN